MRTFLAYLVSFIHNTQQSFSSWAEQAIASKNFSSFSESNPDSVHATRRCPQRSDGNESKSGMLASAQRGTSFQTLAGLPIAWAICSRNFFRFGTVADSQSFLQCERMLIAPSCVVVRYAFIPYYRAQINI